jgi:hypothetical protein
MNLHLRADSVNQAHLHFTVFVDGQNSGQLCMAPEQALKFASIMQLSLLKECRLSGTWATSD